LYRRNALPIAVRRYVRERSLLQTTIERRTALTTLDRIRW